MANRLAAHGVLCDKCGSTRIQKYGRRKVKGSGRPKIVQQYFCDSCGHQFILEEAV